MIFEPVFRLKQQQHFLGSIVVINIFKRRVRRSQVEENFAR